MKNLIKISKKGILIGAFLSASTLGSPTLLIAEQGIISLTFPDGSPHEVEKSPYFKIKKEGNSVTWDNIRRHPAEKISKKKDPRTVYQVRQDLLNRKMEQDKETARFSN